MSQQGLGRHCAAGGDAGFGGGEHLGCGDAGVEPCIDHRGRHGIGATRGGDAEVRARGEVGPRSVPEFPGQFGGHREADGGGSQSTGLSVQPHAAGVAGALDEDIVGRCPHCGKDRLDAAGCSVCAACSIAVPGVLADDVEDLLRTVDRDLRAYAIVPDDGIGGGPCVGVVTHETGDGRVRRDDQRQVALHAVSAGAERVSVGCPQREPGEDQGTDEDGHEKKDQRALGHAVVRLSVGMPAHGAQLLTGRRLLR